MKSHEQEIYERGVEAGQKGGILDDFAASTVPFVSEHFLKGYEEGVAHRYDPHTGKRYHTWDNKGINDPKPQEEEEVVEEVLPEEEKTSCYICGGDHDPVYCDYDNSEQDEIDEEYEREQEERRQEERERELEFERLKRMRNQKAIEGKASATLETILLFPDDKEPDLRIAAIQRLGFSSRHDLEFSALLDDSPSVREAAKRKLQEIGFPIPDELDMVKIQERGADRAHLRFFAIQARYEKNPALKKNAEESLYDYVYGRDPEFSLRYRCDRCGCEWETLGAWENPEIDCRNGCSDLTGIIKAMRRSAEGLITGKNVSGSGHLISSKRNERKRLDGNLNPIVPIESRKPGTTEKEFLLKYRCTRCGHEWNEMDSQATPEAECRMGCSKTGDFWHFYRTIEGLFSGKNAVGVGKLISSENVRELYRGNSSRRKQKART